MRSFQESRDENAESRPGYGFRLARMVGMSGTAQFFFRL